MGAGLETIHQHCVWEVEGGRLELARVIDRPKALKNHLSKISTLFQPLVQIYRWYRLRLVQVSRLVPVSASLLTCVIKRK